MVHYGALWKRHIPYDGRVGKASENGGTSLSHCTGINQCKHIVFLVFLHLGGICVAIYPFKENCSSRYQRLEHSHDKQWLYQSL